jgi:hypothetical protein
LRVVQRDSETEGEKGRMREREREHAPMIKRERRQEER